MPGSRHHHNGSASVAVGTFEMATMTSHQIRIGTANLIASSAPRPCSRRHWQISRPPVSTALEYPANAVPDTKRHRTAPLRGSDRKKLKLRVLQTYPAIEASDGDLLVPDGLQTRKFSTHSEAPGVGPLLSP